MQTLSKLMKSRMCTFFVIHILMLLWSRYYIFTNALLMVDLGTLDSLMVCCFTDSSQILYIFSLHVLILDFAYMFFSVVLMLQ